MTLIDTSVIIKVLSTIAIAPYNILENGKVRDWLGNVIYDFGLTIYRRKVYLYNYLISAEWFVF
jgi:hypothetical protein